MNTINYWFDVLELLGKGWTQNVNAKDKDGYDVPVESRQATCWCLSGPIYRIAKGCFASNKMSQQLYDLLYEEAFDLLPNKDDYKWGGLVGWNDESERTHEEVLDFVATIIESKLAA